MERKRREERFMKWIIYSLFFLLNGNVFAQQYAVQVEVNPVERTGFYRIFLNPTVTGKTQNQLQDIRLFDEKNNEIPIHLSCEDIKKREAIFEAFDVKKQAESNLIFEKKHHNPFSKIVMRVKNRDLTKHFRIQGSNDLKSWTTFNKDFEWNPLRSAKNHKDTIQEHIIDIGENNYKYFKIVYLDSLRQNFDFVGLGTHHKTLLETIYSPIKEPLFEQYFDEKSKQSVFMFSFYQHHFLDRLELTFNKHDIKVKNEAKLYQVYEENGQQKERLLKTFFINDKEKTVIEFEKLFVKKMILRIEHLEKEPLILKKIEGYELKKYLIAYLYRSKKYTLKLGNDILSKSLLIDKKLEEQIVQTLPETTLKEVKKPLKTWKKKKIKALQNQTWYWIAMVLFFVLLVIFVVYLIKENKNELVNEKND